VAVTNVSSMCILPEANGDGLACAGPNGDVDDLDDGCEDPNGEAFAEVPCWLWMGRVLEVLLPLVAFCLAEAVERVAWGCLRCACCLCEGDEVVLVVGRRSMGSRAVS
jgi:hypothetical protein